MKWREFAPLGDLDPMPFGKHKGTPMRYVSASWLWWMWQRRKLISHSAVHDYVRRHRWRIRRGAVSENAWKTFKDAAPLDVMELPEDD